MNDWRKYSCCEGEFVTFSSLNDGSVTSGWGRLGNQLFEIAVLFGIAFKTNRSVSLPSDWRYRDVFPIPQHHFEIGHNVLYNEYRYLGHLYEDPPGGNIDLKGWFQSYKYFHYKRDFIMKIFTPKEIQKIDYCAIHVRRTDYLGFGWEIDKKYYIDNIKKYNENKILVFSDDIAWCKNQFGSDFEYSEEDEITELYRMASCKRIIAANSSYSWWACYLSGHNNCHFPEMWVYGIPYSQTELIIPEWKNDNTM